LWRCEKNLCESTWRRWDLVLERGPFFRHRVPNNAHVIELGSGHVHYKICKDVIAFRAFLEVPSKLIMPNKMAKVQMGIGWVPACWAILLGRYHTPVVPILHVKLELELEPWYNF
jgi:hypothetical protein